MVNLNLENVITLELELQMMKRKHFSETFKWYLKSAEGENHEGEFNLGYCYGMWYLKPAEGEHHTGQNNLETCYDDGIILDIVINIGLERKLFCVTRNSAEGGNSSRQNNLNNLEDCHPEGGDFGRQNSLACCYRDVIGTTNEEEKTFQLINLQKWDWNNEYREHISLDLNFAERKNYEGQIYSWRLESYSVVHESAGENIKGVNNLNLGYCYHEEKEFRWYLKSAEESYSKSAEGGNNNGIINLGYYYRTEIEILKIKKHQNKLKHRCHNLHLAKGGVCSIWKAEWIDVPEELFEFYKLNQVSLEKFNNSQEISSEFLKELIANLRCQNKYVLSIYEKWKLKRFS
ncbi:hypothetical protein Glove_365g84 [Diversispora epigaea]|uniref:Uncharacterized protein n=1 Tax=Diversispora epigaea TaxID=1348612 RepID=A0A397H7X3_9GLOM|nr:hypothetical protein Glove_365g84 [Diversispora epigaea]